jgi:hypothetical protein
MVTVELPGGITLELAVFRHRIAWWVGNSCLEKQTFHSLGINRQNYAEF